MMRLMATAKQPSTRTPDVLAMWAAMGSKSLMVRTCVVFFVQPDALKAGGALIFLALPFGRADLAAA